jgi:hypothetical protein
VFIGALRADNQRQRIFPGARGCNQGAIQVSAESASPLRQFIENDNTRTQAVGLLGVTGQRAELGSRRQVLDDFLVPFDVAFRFELFVIGNEGFQFFEDQARLISIGGAYHNLAAAFHFTMDVDVRHPESFAAIKDLTTA